MEKPVASQKVRIAFTGHRPKYFKHPEVEKQNFFVCLSSFLSSRSRTNTNTVFILGGAQGVDSWGAEYAMKYGFPFELYTPFAFPIHTDGWSDEDKTFLKLCYEKATIAQVVNPGDFYAKGYAVRNSVLVKQSDFLVAYVTVMKSGSGHCIRYAQASNKNVFDLKTGRVLYGKYKT